MHNTRKKLIFFGRLEERKGLPEFVEALNQLAENGAPEFEVTFLGKVVRLYAATSGGLDSKAFIQAKLDGRLRYSIVGDFGSRDAIDVVKKSEGAVVCLASPSDNFPNAALEMGQLARRLVVSDTKGFHQTLDLIGRTESLYWFKPGCSVSLAKAIRAALEDNGTEPKAPAPKGIDQVNQRLLQERLDLLNAAFCAKREQHALEPARIRAAVILSPGQTKTRDIRRSLLSLTRGDSQPDCIVVVGPGLKDEDVRGLEACFARLLVARDTAASLQDLLRPIYGAGGTGEYALIMLAGVALKRTGLTTLATAGARHPALTIPAELVLGCPQRITTFEAPSASMLVRANGSCGSCLAVSMSFINSLPPLPVDRPALALWLLVLTAAAQGQRIFYLPFPQHSIRPSSGLDELRSREPADEELSTLWHYLASLEIGTWSRRELRGLVLSVQQLAFGEAGARQAERRLQNANTELHMAKTELQNANTELHNSKVALRNTQAELASVYASSAWKITGPLRLAADWLRGSCG